MAAKAALGRAMSWMQLKAMTRSKRSTNGRFSAATSSKKRRSATLAPSAFARPLERVAVHVVAEESRARVGQGDGDDALTGPAAHLGR